MVGDTASDRRWCREGNWLYTANASRQCLNAPTPWRTYHAQTSDVDAHHPAVVACFRCSGRRIFGRAKPVQERGRKRESSAECLRINGPMLLNKVLCAFLSSTSGRSTSQFDAQTTCEHRPRVKRALKTSRHRRAATFNGVGRLPLGAVKHRSPDKNGNSLE